ncbi:MULTISPECIES: lipopolysaccharide assembly protein LapB [Edwardsiella]|uniref:Lipopolysaccharide assembly protein B n=2 Tax=Edwardsiella anguillarum TaxID=1821960 RepID=A0A076LDJ0_9GAMM|nr:MULTISPECIES: lipopolysaccharide assembly protein LapB [Edwardsiella]AKM47597.1 tetratricopeptide repeat protein [Edwardsiella sp. EA181011]GAJ69123.1 periplasmic heat shock protein YciM [Edwardsiella piscicida]AIJ06560.1 tetratricopeptide repeat protein [Edwardsiella anguillarum ET080813]AKR78102.1 lipopolysaccharide assembly protein LapB [Edwardsiella sp. LADL05-105]KAB0593209.1 lipopolysaccharide assembly protein LapB [Edwardsiella anguillarum]
MLELLFLLLPVAAAYGWYMGRRSAQQDKQQEANRLSREYVTGVNFLLSNQQDKAVELFLDMLKEDSNTVEAHLTLGNLFRSRGEVDRAIRIHQSLMESASLSFEQRLLAVQQLGRDYMAAGLYDRAEEMFSQLVDEADFRVSALQQLLLIHQATSDWHKAIDAAEKLVRLGKDQQRSEIAHFYCELALQAMGSDDLDRAQSLLKKAAAADKGCARVSIMRGRVFQALGEPAKAVAAFSQVLEQDKAFVSEVLPLMETCYQALEQPEPWHDFLRRCVDEDAGASAELMLGQVIEAQEGLEAAQVYVSRQLQRHPTMRVFHRLIDYHLAEAEDGRARESLQLLRDMVGEQIRTKPRYRCLKCGFTPHSLYWHCPSCRAWATIKPIRGLDGQ